MEFEGSGFFRGVGMAAGQGRSKARKRMLRKDAALLGQLCPRIKGPQAGEEGAVVLAEAWLKFRKKNPTGNLSKEVTRIAAAIKEGGMQVNKIVIRKRIAAPRAGVWFKDQRLVGLFAGAQTGLTLMQPEISSNVLKVDWQSIDESYGEICSLYEANGVPDYAISELVALEYVTARMRRAAGKLSFARNIFGGGGRYGWLRVDTTPKPAKISVDGDDLGESPWEGGVRATNHVVEGMQGKLHGQQEVLVAPSKVAQVDLMLT